MPLKLRGEWISAMVYFMDMERVLKLVFFVFFTGFVPLGAQESTLPQVRTTHPEPENRSGARFTIPGAFSPVDLPSGRIQPQIMGPINPSAFCFTPDGQYLAGAVNDLIAYYDVETGRFIDSLGAQAGPIRAMVFSNDGNELVLITGGANVFVVNPLTGRTLRTLERESYGNPYYRLYISPDGNRIAALSSDGFDDFYSTGVTLWDFHSGEILWSRDFDWTDIITLSFDTGSNRLLVPYREEGGPAGYRELDAETGELLAQVHLDGSDFSSSGYAPHILYQPTTDRLLYTHEYLGSGFLHEENHTIEDLLFDMVSHERYSRPVFRRDGRAFALTTEAHLIVFTGTGFQDRRVVPMEREALGRYESMPLGETAFDPTGEYLFALSHGPFIYHLPTGQRVPLQTVLGQELMGMELTDQGESLFCLTKSGDSVHVIHWENPGEPGRCRISGVVSIPYLEREDMGFQGSYNILDSQQGILLVEMGAYPVTQGNHRFEMNVYSGESGDFLYNIRNISIRDNLAVNPQGTQILIQHTTGRYGVTPYHLSLSFLDLETGEITDHHVWDLSEMVPDHYSPYDEFFLNNPVFIDNDTLELDFYSHSYWSGQSGCSKIRWTLGEPFDLEDLNAPDNTGSRRDSYNRDILRGNIRAVFQGNGSIRMEEGGTGEWIQTLHMAQPGIYAVLDREGTLYSDSQGRRLFPIVEDLIFREPVRGPDRVLFYGRVNNDGLRVRSQPNLQGDILGQVNRGDPVGIYRQSNEPATIGGHSAYWYYIRSESGLTGWVFGHYLDDIP